MAFSTVNHRSMSGKKRKNEESIRKKAERDAKKYIKDVGVIATWATIKRGTMIFNKKIKEKAAELEELDAEIERLEREEDHD